MNPLADEFSLLQSSLRRRPETEVPPSPRPSRADLAPALEAGDGDVTEPPAIEGLVGAHAVAVEDLVALVQSRDLRGDDVVLLRAPSGQGKSRVVREVYRRLAEEETYWPRLPGQGAQGDLAARKRLGPDPARFRWVKDAMPTFGWWHLNCEDLVRGSAADFTGDLERQLKAHTIPLELALHRADEGYRRLVEKVGHALGDWVKDVVAGAVQDQAAAALTQLIPVPGLAQLIGLGTLGAKGIGEHVRNSRALHADLDTGAGVVDYRREHIESLAGFIRALSSPALPAVVVVEDLHAMSEEFETFLNALLAHGEVDSHHRVVLIGTCWPEGSRLPYQRWVKSVRSADVRQLSPLTTDDLAGMVCAAAPGTARDVAVDVARASDNPLTLKRWLALPTVRRTIAGPGGQLTAESVALLRPHIAEALDELQQERWDELAGEVQEALMYAIASDGATDGSVGYVPAVVAGLVAGGDVHRVESLMSALDSAVAPAAWVRRFDDLDVTEGTATRCIARAASRELPLGPLELKELPRRASRSREQYLRCRVDAAPVGVPMRSPAASHAAEQLLRRRGNDTSSEWWFLATYVRASDGYEARDLEAASGLVLSLGAVPSRVVSARAMASAAVLAARCVQAIAAQDCSLLDAVSTMLAGALNAPGSKRALGEHELGIVRRHAEEIAGLLDAARGKDIGRLLDSRAQAIHRDSARVGATATVAALARLAMYAYSAKGRRQAIPHMREAFDLARAELGSEASLTMETGIAYLALVGHDGNTSEHVALVSGLVDVARRTYGKNDHRTLNLLRQQLRWELKSGASRELAERFDALVGATEQLVGPLGSISITARIEQSQAWSRCDGRDAQRGVRLIAALLEETRSAFGPDHPTTRRVDWFRQKQVEPYALTRDADTSAFRRASPAGEARSADATWTEEDAAALRSYYGVRKP